MNFYIHMQRKIKKKTSSYHQLKYLNMRFFPRRMTEKIISDSRGVSCVTNTPWIQTLSRCQVPGVSAHERGTFSLLIGVTLVCCGLRRQEGTSYEKETCHVVSVKTVFLGAETRPRWSATLDSQRQ